MKFALTALLLICHIAKGQEVVNGVIDTKHLSVEIYKSQDTTNCNFLYSGLQRGVIEFYILDKVFCDNKYWYRVYHNNSPGYYIDSKFFGYKNIIDSNLNILSRGFPTIKQRVNQITILDQKLKQEEKKYSDSVNAEADKTLKTLRDKNIVLVNWSFSYSNEYSSFVDIDINLINPYKQKIKYAYITFQAFNPVGDIVKSPKGKTTETVTAIGPIEYSQDGTYKFENVFYSKVIDSMKITSIKIQFFDGTTKTIPFPKSLDIE